MRKTHAILGENLQGILTKAGICDDSSESSIQHQEGNFYACSQRVTWQKQQVSNGQQITGVRFR